MLWSTAQQRLKLPISTNEFIQRYPTLYHVSLASNLEQVQRHGLRSTTALLDLFEIRGQERFTLESCRRPSMVTIKHPVHGEAVLNDQFPLNESVLGRCLVGMTNREWFENLNRRVFLWPDLRRAKRFLEARMASSHKRVILAVQTKDLVELTDSIELSAINSGTAIRNAPPRGKNTFLPLAQYPFEERRRRTGPGRAVAEVTALYAILNRHGFAVLD